MQDLDTDMDVLKLITLNPVVGPESRVLPPADEHPRKDVWTPLKDLQLPDSLDALAKRDTWALPTLEARELYHGERHFDYWASGLADAFRMAKVFGTWALPSSQLGGKGSCVLDLGCASGRVVRHFAAQMPDVEVWGADINRAHVEWVLANLSPRIKAFQCSALPHLPLSDGQFSMISAFSVFTHIEELELAWLLEVRRCLKPGGIAYITLHTDHTWQRLGPNVPVWNMIQECKDQHPDLDLSASAFKDTPMPRPRILFDHRSRALYNVNIFHRTDYIESVWGRFFDVCEFLRSASGYQDVVVLRKPT